MFYCIVQCCMKWALSSRGRKEVGAPSGCGSSVAFFLLQSVLCLFNWTVKLLVVQPRQSQTSTKTSMSPFRLTLLPRSVLDLFPSPAHYQDKKEDK